MPVKWIDGKPYGECGAITWNCPYDSIDPQCCQYEDHLENLKRGEIIKLEYNYGIQLDEEYGPKENPYAYKHK